MPRIQRTLEIMVVAALTIGGFACAPVQVNTSLERGMNFTEYKSFAFAAEDKFVTGDPRLDNNEFFVNQIKKSAARVLESRGFEATSPATAQLVIHYHANVNQQIDVNELDSRYGYCESCQSSVYSAGTITLDFVDARTNHLVWRGWAEGSLDGIDNQELIEQRVDDAVTRILAKLPPRV